MGFVHQSMPYPAAFDYGPRAGRPTLAVVFHMAEGQNVAQYLSRAPARGVSVHYTIEQQTSTWRDGEVVRCLPERRISGSINPHTIRKDNDPDGYYGAKWAREALGDLWSNPNVAVISVEVAGRAAEGPTRAQQDSMVALYEELDRRYGGIAVLAHRDFQNVKMCPGRSAGMKSALARMGRGEEQRYMSTRGFVAGQVCDVRPEAPLFDFPGGSRIGTVTGEDLTRSFLGWSPKGRDFALVSSDLKPAGRTAWIRAGDVANVRGSTPDGEAEYAAGRAAGLEEAEAAVAAIDREG
jgi:hypothetical protein